MCSVSLGSWLVERYCLDCYAHMYEFGLKALRFPDVRELDYVAFQETVVYDLHVADRRITDRSELLRPILRSFWNLEDLERARFRKFNKAIKGDFA